MPVQRVRQSAELAENIDDQRTGCEVDADKLLEGYEQWDANQLHFGSGPTPTPRPVRSDEVAAKVFLETVWGLGCATGRRDAVGVEQATLMGLRDRIPLLDQELTALEATASPTPTPTN